MMRDAESKTFSVVLVYTFDRFARNRYDSAIYKSKLKQNGCHLESATQPMGEGPESILFESIMEGYAEYYSENLSRNVKRGMTENALAGKSIGGRTLGYKAVNGYYVIDEVEAQAVHKAFEMYDQGYGKKTIIDTLNADGYKGRQGGKLSFSALDTMLSNEKYIGIYNYAGVRIEDGMPAIIEKELFESVQKRLETRKKYKARNKASEPYLLSGKLFCGHCGKMMVGECGRSHTGQMHYYYKCQGRKKKKCGKHTERKSEIEQYVLHVIYDEILTDEIIEMVSAKTYDLLVQEAQDKSKLVLYLSQLEEVTGKLNNVLSAIEQGIITSSTKQRLEDLEARKGELEGLVVEEQMKKPAFTKDHIAFWLESLKQGNLQDPEYQRVLVDAFVNSVYIFDQDGGKSKKLVIACKTDQTFTRVLKGSDIAEFGLPSSDYPNLRIGKNIIVLTTIWQS
jgi:hypothetical protein